MSVRPLFDEHMSRFRPDGALRQSSFFRGQASNAAAHVPEMPDIDDQINDSIVSIQRVVENYSALQDNVRYFKDLSDKNEQKLRLEKEANVQLGKKLVDAQSRADELQSLLVSEREQLDEANNSIAMLKRVVGGLEDEISAVRAKALRLVKGVEVLMATENHINMANATQNLRAV